VKAETDDFVYIITSLTICSYSCCILFGNCAPCLLGDDIEESMKRYASRLSKKPPKVEIQCVVFKKATSEQVWSGSKSFVYDDFESDYDKALLYECITERSYAIVDFRIEFEDQKARESYESFVAEFPSNEIPSQFCNEQLEMKEVFTIDGLQSNEKLFTSHKGGNAKIAHHLLNIFLVLCWVPYWFSKMADRLTIVNTIKVEKDLDVLEEEDN